MKLRKFILLAILIAPALSFTGFAQENDDMYFSRKDRDKLSASTSFTNHSSTSGNSEYASNHNFYSSTIQSTTAGSPTVQATSHEEADNNQYFIKDYSIKNKTDNEVKTYSGINTSNGYQSGINVIFLFGSAYNSQFYGAGLYNPINDPFSPYYDPFYRYRSGSYYASYSYDPWRYNRNYRYGYNNNNYNSYSNSSNTCVTTSYSNNVRNEIKFQNGRKVIVGSRSSRSGVRPTENQNRGRATINSGNNVSTNGRSTNAGKRSSYRKYKSTSQNRNTFNRSNNNINSSGWNRKSNSNSSSNFRSSGSSSGSRPSYSSGNRSSGSRSSGSSSRSSSGSSRSTKKRGN